MIEKQTFVSILKNLKEEMDNALKISKEINNAFIKNGRPYNEETDISDKIFPYELFDKILTNIKDEFGKDGWLLEHFVYECDWGKYPVYEDGRVTTLEELYDDLVRICKKRNLEDKKTKVEDKPISLYLSQILGSIYDMKPYENSGYYLVLQDCGHYKRGCVYRHLGFMSNIHPSFYTELTWGEFYKYCECFESEIHYPDGKSACLKDPKLRSVSDILNDYDNNSLH